MNTLERIENIGIVPVVKISKASDALPLAFALYKGGIDCAEITFRSDYALEAIKTINKALPDMLLGAGTIRNVAQAKEAIDAGASFIVTPGFNHEVVKWCIEHNVLVMPGISSATELETALSYGLTNVKFFPAQSSGGAQKIKDLSGPYPQIKFMPTGGINAENMHEYLSLPSVIAIGGSFMLPQASIDDGDFETIELLSKQAVKSLLNYELIHLGINSENEVEGKKTAELLCFLFDFKFYQKPKSQFAGRGFEILNTNGRGTNGHFALYTPYPQKALYQLKKKGINPIESSITRNKKTNQINFVYLDIEISGFGVHLINPDVKM
ncbi:MAG: bifunctional 4-hydroxy-2-oxoglutarate aldolase/2-dehydro-3-deoxy-phosphogluconate aldolase [Erysipelotrichaceae bacterium]